MGENLIIVPAVGDRVELQYLPGHAVKDGPIQGVVIVVDGQDFDFQADGDTEKDAWSVLAVEQEQSDPVVILLLTGAELVAEHTGLPE